MDIEYHAFGTINRTVYPLPCCRWEPETFWGRDLQQQPPWGWCDKCGKEVYKQGGRLCEDCKKTRRRDAAPYKAFVMKNKEVFYGLEEGSGR